MKYRYAALFAAAAVAAPLRQGAEDIAPRSEEGLVGKVGVAAVVAGDGDATGVKNAKRGGVTDDIGVGLVALGDGDGTGVKNAKRGGITDDIGVGAVVGDGDGTGVKNAKRSEDDVINLGGGGHYGGYYDDYDDGALLDVLKRSQDGGVTDDIGVGVVALGDGDGTGVKNAKRDVVGLGDDILGHDQYYDDGDLLSVLRRTQDGGVTDDIGVGAVVGGDGDGTGVKNAKRGGVTDDIGAGVVALGDGDGTGVKNAKRFEIGDVDIGSTGVGRTDSGIPIIDPNL